MADSVKEIAEVIRLDSGEKAGSENTFGEEQVAMDIKADTIVRKKLEASGEVALIASEEMEEELKLESGDYAVAHDPLDGSSLVDVNLAVGSIFGVYRASSFFGLKGDDQMASVVGVYGPRTALFVTVRKGVAYFVLRNGVFEMERDGLSVGEGKMFAPGNLRACSQREDYLKLLEFWTRNQYTLRYSGGMVPDVGQILLKGKGIFTYPAYEDQPDGKLRLLYECAPIALLFEEAGGAATDGERRILEKEIVDLAQRSPILVGSKVEVARAQDFLR